AAIRNARLVILLEKRNRRRRRTFLASVSRRHGHALKIGLDCVMKVMAARRPAAGKDKGDRLHRGSVVALRDADIPFLIGGAYVVEVYAGVSRHTKDFDLHLRPQHVGSALNAL